MSALAANDQPALSKLSIDQSEFKKYVWPTLAMQMSGSNTSADKYYVTYQKVNQVGITRKQHPLAGKKWEVVKVNLGPPQRKSKGFQLFGAPSVTLRDESGQEKTMRLVGGLLERDGAYKVTSYYVILLKSQEKRKREHCRYSGSGVKGEPPSNYSTLPVSLGRYGTRDRACA